MTALDASNVLRIERGPADLARLYPWLESGLARLDLSETTRHAMHMSLEEAVMNVVMHGFEPDAPAEVGITLEAEAHAMVLVVEDTGRPFDPSSAPVPVASGPSSVGGRGLLLLRHFCRDIAYLRDEGRNRLTLRFPRA